jgi:hypothetical protein
MLASIAVEIPVQPQAVSSAIKQPSSTPEPEAAVGLADVGVEQPLLPGLADHLAGVLTRLVVMDRRRADLFGREVAGRLADHLLIFTQAEVQHQVFVSIWFSSPAGT